MKECPEAEVLWDKVVEEMKSKVIRFMIWRVTVGQEICPKTVKEKKKAKVHFHLVAEWANKVRAGRWSDWALAGVMPANARRDGTFEEGDESRKRKKAKESLFGWSSFLQPDGENWSLQCVDELQGFP